MIFNDNGSGGNAQFITTAGGSVDFGGSAGSNAAGSNAAGSIAGAGEYLIGDIELTVGSNNLSTTLSGTLGGANSSLVKVGIGTLTISGAASDFNSIKETKKGAQRDKILDFSHGQHDRIDLRTIDAKTGGGNQKFKFIGDRDFHDKKGELRYEDKGSKVIVQGDVNGDGKADFEIYVAEASLSKSDFFL